MNLDELFSLHVADDRISNAVNRIIIGTRKSSVITQEEIFAWDHVQEIRDLNKKLDGTLIQKLNRWNKVVPSFTVLKYLLRADKKDLLLQATDTLESCFLDGVQLDPKKLMKTLTGDVYDYALAVAFITGEENHPRVKNDLGTPQSRDKFELPKDFK